MTTAPPAAHRAGIGSNVSVIAMISAVAATIPTRLTSNSTLFRRLAAAWS